MRVRIINSVIVILHGLLEGTLLLNIIIGRLVANLEFYLALAVFLIHTLRCHFILRDRDMILFRGRGVSINGLYALIQVAALRVLRIRNCL